MDAFNEDNSSVKVAVRIRPLVQSEIARGCQNILEVHESIKQIRIKDSDKGFTYNFVFDHSSSQEHFYNTAIKDVIDNLFKGYNVTVLAYGQTGSGKTHSMGTTYDGEGEMGVIPRAINDIFNYVNDNFVYDFTISVSFTELYQEVLYDLLSNRPREQSTIEIREDAKSIIIPGLTEEAVTSVKSTLECLSRGSSRRATGSTNMNAQSSRSHAIFTINVCMQKKGDSNLNKTAKFHLVDLAGSERSKKTGATGVTFKEGVNINKGLLALGNVISALGEEKQQNYVGYRDSNLTRLLKDSLGGNSITLMVACVSPADYNLEETVSTLRYADRARKIKNKPVVNQDPKAAEINRLKKLVQQLQLELVGQGGPIICQAELDLLRNENENIKRKNVELTMQLSSTLNENSAMFERVMLMQSANERMTEKLKSLKDEYNITLTNLNFSLDHHDENAIKEHMTKLQVMNEQFEEINTEQKKNEEEIRKHESSNSCVTVANPELATESEFNEKHESHTLQQMRLNTELQQVTKMLAMKEHLAQQIAANTCNMVEYGVMEADQEKVLQLQKEKDELLQQLKNIQTHGSNKLAEQRRKRVQELEKEIHDLHKKINEQGRLIKLKEKDEQKIKQLNSEIQQMKQTKVKLIKNMRQESEKFRVWKLQREREVQKLKDQDRKRQNQMMKMETMYSRQQNVLKRKVEQAAAINKRLKDVLALRKNAQDQKNTGKIERIGPWIQHEIDVLVNTIEAEVTLNGLLDDRATLYVQLEDLRNQSDPNEEQINQLQDEIDLRSTQIQELQQKILDSDQENRSKTRWDSIQSMSEAKCALRSVIDIICDIKKKEISSETKLMELQTSQAEMIKKAEEQERRMNNLEAQCSHEISVMQKEYEEKISVLLRQLRGIKVEGVEGELKEICSMQEKLREGLEEEISELQLKLSNFDKLTVEHEELRKKLKQIQANEATMKEKPKKLNNSTSKHLDTTYSKKDGDLKLKSVQIEDGDSDISINDDTENDPDWRKTPLGKRIVKLRNSSMQPTKLERMTTKRSSDGGCACRGNCAIRNCGCKKLNKSCGSSCKCSELLCINKTSDNSENMEEEQSNEETEEEPFKKPRPLQENGMKSTRRTKNLFPNIEAN